MEKKGIIKKILTPLKFAASSIISFIVDYGIYAFLIGGFFNGQHTVLDDVGVAYIIARAISSVVNFTMNKLLVFSSKEKKKTVKQAVMYFILVVFIAVSGSLLTNAAVNFLSINKYIAKIIVDGGLFVVSYFVQRKIIFKQDKEENN